MLKVVIDTNVFISALLFGGKPKEIVELARSGLIRNATSLYIIEEVKGILIAKFLWDPDMAEQVAQGIAGFSEVVDPEKEVDTVRDCEADNRIIECAVTSGAHFIVSGDRHLTCLKEYKGIGIIDPPVFLELLEKK